MQLGCEISILFVIELSSFKFVLWESLEKHNQLKLYLGNLKITQVLFQLQN